MATVLKLRGARALSDFRLAKLLTRIQEIDPGVRAWAYATGQVIFTQLYMITVGVGVLNRWRDDRRALAAEPSH